MNTLHWILISIITSLVGAISFILLRKNRQLEDLYDDLLDSKAALKLAQVSAQVSKKRDAYEKAIKEYSKTLLSQNSANMVFVLATEPDDSPSTDPDSGPTPSLPKRTDKLH